MKKTLVALAALAATGAFAQSSLTISGQLDAGLSQTKLSTGLKTTTEAGGIHGASRLRFTGSEDMGGGLKTNFLLEMQPGVSDGSTSTAGLFNRGAWMGMSGGFGEMRLGKQSTAAMGVICGADLLGCYSGFSGGGILFGGNGVGTRWISGQPNRGQQTSTVLAQASDGDRTRYSRAVTYITPNMSGFTGTLQYAFGGAASNQANGNGTATALALQYANGPLAAGLVFQSAAADAALNATGKQTTLGASYDLGVAKIGFAYQSETASSNLAGTFAQANAGKALVTTANGLNYGSAKAWALSAAFPMGAATPYVRIGNHKTDGLGAFGIINGVDSSIVNVGARYALSKRTLAYFDYATDSKGASGYLTNGTSPLAGAASTSFNSTKPTIFSVGLQHTF